MRIEHPYEYYDLVRQVEQAIAEGTLALVAGNCRLSDIRRDAPWPEDYIEHTFRCVSCDQRFQLAVETYHGSGGAWRAMSETGE